MFEISNVKEYVEFKKKELKRTMDNDIYTLSIIQFGDNPESNKYINGKIKDCIEMGIRTILFKTTLNEKDKTKCRFMLHTQITEPDGRVSNEYMPLWYANQALTYGFSKHARNVYNHIDGVIIQEPIDPIYEVNSMNMLDTILNLFDDIVDVDGFIDPDITPCTAEGIYNFLVDCGVNIEGSKILIINRSHLVGKPLAKRLVDAHANVSIVNSTISEEDLYRLIAFSDIIVSGTGHRIITKDKYYRALNEYNARNRDKILIDVGMHIDPETGKLAGDCDPNITELQTPVPGGVGLLTRLALLHNFIINVRKNK